MLLALALSLPLRDSVRSSALLQTVPRYTLDVRDAPTAAVFAMMLVGRETYVSRGLPRFVSLRLTERQIALPEPSPSETYGDYWPIKGWLEHLQRAMGVHGLTVGYEREGGAFYVSVKGKDPEGSDVYVADASLQREVWNRVWSKGDESPSSPPFTPLLSRLRLAGLRWTERAASRRAVLVAHTARGEMLTRVVREGSDVGVGGFKVVAIDPGKITFTGKEGDISLDLHGSLSSDVP